MEIELNYKYWDEYNNEHPCLKKCYGEGGVDYFSALTKEGRKTVHIGQKIKIYRGFVYLI